MARQVWKKNQMHMVSVERMTAEAIEFIRKHEPEDGYFVAFSGGKDSIVTLELVRMAGVKHQAFYSATGIDPPELCKFIKKYYQEVTWLKPKLNFYEGVRTKFPPSKFRRWCCDELKKDAAMKIPLSHYLLGIRAEESFKRSQRPRIDRGMRGLRNGITSQFSIGLNGISGTLSIPIVCHIQAYTMKDSTASDVSSAHLFALQIKPNSICTKNDGQNNMPLLNVRCIGGGTIGQQGKTP